VLVVVTAGLAELAGDIVVVFGFVVVGVIVEPLPAAVVEAPDAGVLVVAAAGKLVRGVGSGGNGFDNTLAINSGKPVSCPPWRYLYQVLSPSIHSFLGLAYFASVPASATARA
jgi:hypothetical protein